MASHDEEPYRGELPAVHDEAADSPRWLPALGFALLCLVALVLGYRAATAAPEVDAAAAGAAADPADAVPAAAEGGGPNDPMPRQMPPVAAPH